MIILVLRFAFRDGTTAEEEAAVLARMRRTADTDPVVFSTVGQYLGDPGDGWTHAYCAGVTGPDALRGYLYDPVHLDGDAGILPYLSRLSPFQLSDDMSPELGETVAAMHLEKVAAYPWWGRLLDAIPG